MTDADGDWLWHNRQNWNDRVRVHSASDFYDLPRFREGVSTLRPFEIPEVGDVAGRRLVHLQCHMGQDTLSWARLGADVTGLDFSEDAIRTARELAADIGMADRARFVVSDVYEAPSALDGELFDIVYTGLGALVWLPDLTSWARTAASLLKEEGALYLAEFHPLTELLEQDGRTVEHDYFQSEGRTSESPFTYTDGPTLTRTTSVQWQHTLGGVVTALAGAGLRIEFLHEHETLLFKRFPQMERHGSLDYRFPEGHPRLPLMYSIRAVKGS
ncbi:class I SAM-dependent methyltransferase [Streptomyces albidus (ex Kaewkla and Franco 2022)]|uniref:class I SAM-dependent methyltransferase n=1 Tax=Streptomyces albidus (ex Kaewkla and Franco 2022) TaxID=722709 RepID=UPI0015EFA9E3|nr:class I SAM-dependent methyltransferase [Streptomyces albidus (ex Kaewkla and Franco 2022)]